MRGGVNEVRHIPMISAMKNSDSFTVLCILVRSFGGDESATAAEPEAPDSVIEAAEDPDAEGWASTVIGGNGRPDTVVNVDILFDANYY
jgi:hypothetical protein